MLFCIPILFSALSKDKSSRERLPDEDDEKGGGFDFGFDEKRDSQLIRAEEVEKEEDSRRRRGWWIRKWVVRWRNSKRKMILFNHCVLVSTCLYLLVTTGLNLATTIYPLVHVPPHYDTSVGCNGREEYCNRRYDNISQIGTHGSPFWGVTPAHNQNLGIRMQMDAGIRFLQAQTHKSPIYGQMKACHTSCLVEDAGTLEDYLLKVKDWLLAPGHEREVVTLLLTNGDYVDIGAYENIFRKVDMEDLMYMPEKQGLPLKRRNSVPEEGVAELAAGRTPLHPRASGDQKWPTLGEMIKSGERLVVFLDYGAKPSKVPYILDEFDYFWEGPFDTVDPEFNQCAIDRPVLSPQNKERVLKRMYIVNHYLDTKILGFVVPNRRDAHRTNALEGKSGIKKQVELCLSAHDGKWPRVVLVDYFDAGQVRKAEAWMNGVW